MKKACDTFWRFVILTAAITVLLGSICLVSDLRDAKAQQVPALPMTALGYCQMTVNSSTALASCSGGIPSGANAIVVRAEAQALRYRLDGATTAPTTTVGMPILVADQPLLLQSGSAGLAAIRFIAQTSGGILNVNFYRAPS